MYIMHRSACISVSLCCLSNDIVSFNNLFVYFAFIRYDIAQPYISDFRVLVCACDFRMNLFMSVSTETYYIWVRCVLSTTFVIN